MNSIKTLTAFISSALISTASFAHTGMALDSGTMVTGLLHPFTGVDHLLGLMLLGGIISLLYSQHKPAIKRGFAGVFVLAVLLSWSFLHYSGEHFTAYALGFAISSTLMMAAGVQITGISKRFKTARSQNKN